MKNNVKLFLERVPTHLGVYETPSGDKRLVFRDLSFGAAVLADAGFLELDQGVKWGMHNFAAYFKCACEAGREIWSNHTLDDSGKPIMLPGISQKAVDAFAARGVLITPENTTMVIADSNPAEGQNSRAFVCVVQRGRAVDTGLRNAQSASVDSEFHITIGRWSQ